VQASSLHHHCQFDAREGLPRLARYCQLFALRQGI
jgi:hypothetical protein